MSGVDITMNTACINKYKKRTNRTRQRVFENQPVFLLDSTDFAVVGFHGITKKNENWSYKLNRPGRRYQLLSDGFGTPLKIFGSYSPKTYDGSWVSFNRNWLDDNLQGCVAFGDCHYWSSQDEVQKMKLMASMPKTVKLNNTIVSVGFKSINIKS